MKPGESRGASGPLAQLAQLKEAGRLWLEAVDRYESGDGDLEKRMRDVSQTSKETQTVFRRILELKP